MMIHDQIRKEIFELLCRSHDRASKPPGQPPISSKKCRTFSGVRHSPRSALRLSPKYAKNAKTDIVAVHTPNPFDHSAGASCTTDHVGSTSNTASSSRTLDSNRREF